MRSFNGISNIIKYCFLNILVVRLVFVFVFVIVKGY